MLIEYNDKGNKARSKMAAVRLVNEVSILGHNTEMYRKVVIGEASAMINNTCTKPNPRDPTAIPNS